MGSATGSTPAAMGSRKENTKQKQNSPERGGDKGFPASPEPVRIDDSFQSGIYEKQIKLYIIPIRVLKINSLPRSPPWSSQTAGNSRRTLK